MKRATKDLLAHWNETKTAWHDDVSREFEADHIVPLVSKLRSAETALSHMVEVLNRMHRDCE